MRQSGGRTIVMVNQGLPWSLNGGAVVATVVAQWMLLVGQRRHNGGTREAEASFKLIHNVYKSTHLLRGAQWPTPVHTFCDQGNVCAILLPLLSAMWETELLGHTICVTILNMLKTLLRPWRPWWGLNFLCATLWTTKAIFRPPLGLQLRPGKFCGRTREAQRYQSLCKGGINAWIN